MRPAISCGTRSLLQVRLSFARTDEESARIAWDQWRQCALRGTQLADLPSPAAFDAAVEHVSPSDILEKLRASADVAASSHGCRRTSRWAWNAFTFTTSPPAIRSTS